MKFSRFLPAVAAGVLLVAGCSSDTTLKDLAAMNTSNIQRVANVYTGYQNGHGGSGPKDENELKAYIKANDPAKMGAVGFDVNDPEKQFVSERDGKPFKIRWNIGGGRGAVAPVVFEDVGVNGKRQVGFTGGTVEEVDDARYKDLWSGKSSTPSAGGPGGGPGGGGRPTGAPPGAPKGPGG